MNLLVCISKTPETTAKISFAEGDTQFNTDGVQYIMNPYDEWYALVRAIELKEAIGAKVVAINVGPASNDIVIRKALAIGADEAVRIDAESESASFVAKQISHYAKENQFDIIFCGKESIDYNGSLVAAMIAEHLDMPFASYVSDMQIEDGIARLTCDIEGGVEVLKMSCPFVLSASKGLAEQRIPNMRGIMMAKKKPLTVQAAVEFNSKESIAKYRLPVQKSGVKLVDPDNMDELVRLLNEEAKVL
jgi:electron transfer flavoprotein beta subunit